MRTDSDAKTPEVRLVGADRVLAVMIALADHPRGASLEEIARDVGSSKSTVHRALATLRRAGLVTQLSRGLYALGDEFFHLAFRSFAARPESAFIVPRLHQLAQMFGETVHYAVLDGAEVVYRAKVDSPSGAIRLTSTVGGRNPAQVTAVGKVLLAHAAPTLAALGAIMGDAYPARTAHSILTVHELWDELERTRQRGYGVDDQESELGINCIAVPVHLDPDLPPVGAVSVSALSFRVPLERLIERVDDIRAVVSVPAPRVQ